MKRSLPFFISTAVLIGLLGMVDFSSAAKLLSDPDWVALAAGVLFYVGSIVLRGVRFRLLMPYFSDNHIGSLCGFDIAALVAFANHILPFRMGEAIFVVLARMLHQVLPSHALLLLIAVRVYDIISLVIVFVVAAIWVNLKIAPTWYVGVVVLTMALFAIAVRPDWFVKAVLTLLWSANRMLKIDRFHILQRMNTTLALAFKGIKALRSPVIIAANLGLSVSVWLCIIGCFHQYLVAFGLPMKFSKVVIGSIGASLTALMPINAIGNIGTLEAGWTVGFVAMGMDRSAAIASGLAMHAIVIVTSAILAAYSVVRIGIPACKALLDWKMHDEDD